MKVSELLDKFDLDIDLTDELLNKVIKGDYSQVKKETFLLDTIDFTKKEFEGYRFIGKNCECLITPQNNVRTVACYYKKDNFTHGYSYNHKGDVSSIV